MGGSDELDDLDDLDSRERARARRRDHDLAAAERELMRTGQAKVFKQVLDRQARRAAEPSRRGRRDHGAASGAEDMAVQRGVERQEHPEGVRPRRRSGEPAPVRPPRET